MKTGNNANACRNIHEFTIFCDYLTVDKNMERSFTASQSILLTKYYQQQ